MVATRVLNSLASVKKCETSGGLGFLPRRVSGMLKLHSLDKIAATAHPNAEETRSSGDVG